MTPWEAEQKENQARVRSLFAAKYSKIKFSKPKYSEGDFVKLFVDKGKFGKRRYKSDFTKEVFVINKVYKNLPRPRYQLKDLSGAIIKGNAGQHELSQYIPPKM